MPVVHQVHVEDICPRLPDSPGEINVIGSDPGPDLHRYGHILRLQGADDLSESCRVFQEELAAPGLDHRRLPAVGIDLIDHPVLKDTCDISVSGRGAPAEVDAGHHIALFQGIDLPSQLFQGVVIQKLFPTFLCHLPACIDGGAVDRVTADEGDPDMSRSLKDVGCIHNAGHGCDRHRRLYNPIVYEELKTIICFHHTSIPIGGLSGY